MRLVFQASTMLVNRACASEMAAISCRRRPRSGGHLAAMNGALQLVDRLAPVKQRVNLAPIVRDGQVVAQKQRVQQAPEVFRSAVQRFADCSRTQPVNGMCRLRLTLGGSSSRSSTRP